MLHTLTVCLTLIAADPQPPSSASVEVPVLITLIREVDVPAQENGVLARVFVRAGQRVESGMVLGELDTTDAELAASRAQAELEIARAEAGNELKIRSAENLHQVAETELQRAIELNRKYPNSVSDTEMDRLRLTRDSAAIQIEQARHELEVLRLRVKLKESDLEIARRQLTRRRIRAPSSGSVVEVDRNAGEWVQPGERVFRVVDANRVRAEGFLEADQATPGLTDAIAKVQVRTADGQLTSLEGRVVFIDPELNSVNGQFRIWAEFENRDNLLQSGEQVVMTIFPGTGTDDEQEREDSAETPRSERRP
ncbi:Macrolide export protein MacA [Maioricimonas rarisocia]|uniref:Macrolide export protein MacA n=1 Tax=Maioricimonas rarisocia TaxID=2528026 RepID=A0A517Z9U8_9PLAN|nr:efflux RND transporter periplasmic adaptor subunit [Maioricimonas rarisocia]QDU39264.1 Macrolide export protein MacA [Maioricimonas rarisocia]